MFSTTCSSWGISTKRRINSKVRINREITTKLEIFAKAEIDLEIVGMKSLPLLQESTVKDLPRRHDKRVNFKATVKRSA